MNFKRNINILRRFLVHQLVRYIGNSSIKRKGDFLTNSKVKSILVCRPNHRLGNLLLITPLLQEVQKTFPDCRIDLFTKGTIAPLIFKNYENIEHIIQLPRKPFNDFMSYVCGWLKLRSRHYDIAINADRNSSSGRLSVLFSRSSYKFLGESDDVLRLRYNDYCHIAKNSVYNFRYYLNQLGVCSNVESVPLLDLRLSSDEKEKGRKILNQLTGGAEQVIALFTYGTGDKCYSASWWENFYKWLKNNYPGYCVIEILPIENISKLSFSILSFYSKDIREIGSVMANTALFIGADSGMMHLSAASQIPTIGLFSVTDPCVYRPYGCCNTAVETNTIDQVQWKQLLDGILR